MKKILLIVAFCFATLTQAQWTHGVEFGGSNFMGLSFISQYQINLSKTTPIYIAPKLGVGHALVWDFAMMVEGGFDVGYWFDEKQGLAFTTSMNVLFDSPFAGTSNKNLFISTNRGSYLWYSGLDYKLKKNKVIYSFGAGVISLISRYPNFIENGGITYRAEDFVPMLKVGVSF